MLDSNSYDSRGGEKKRLVNNTDDGSREDEIIGLPDTPYE